MNAGFIEQGVVNRFAFIESPVVYPVGRFTYMGPEQDENGIIYMAFRIPSKSNAKRKERREYKLLLDPFTMRTSCACEYKQIHRSVVKITELPESCCWHLRHLSLWVKRKANRQKIEDMQTALEHYYDMNGISHQRVA